jgi:hypothetical protein
VHGKVGETLKGHRRHFGVQLMSSAELAVELIRDSTHVTKARAATATADLHTQVLERTDMP